MKETLLSSLNSLEVEASESEVEKWIATAEQDFIKQVGVNPFVYANEPSIRTFQGSSVHNLNQPSLVYLDNWVNDIVEVSLNGSAILTTQYELVARKLLIIYELVGSKCIVSINGYWGYAPDYPEIVKNAIAKKALTLALSEKNPVLLRINRYELESLRIEFSGVGQNLGTHLESDYKLVVDDYTFVQGYVG